MVSTTTIRRLDIRATTQGVTESTKQLGDLQKSHNAVAIATDKSAQRQLSAAGSYDKLLKSVDENYRSQQRLASGQAILDRAFQQGLITAQEQARAMDLLREKYGTTAQAANDNAEGFRLNSEEALQLAGHLKTVAVAAYTLSPAFRQMVNPAIAAGLRTTGGALSAMSPAAATVAATIASRMMPALSMLARIAIPITIVSETIRAMGEITELGARKIEEFSKLSKDAYAAGVTTDFFLRQAESAKKFVDDADQATAALKRFREVTTEKLGGSEFGNRLSELANAGNFTGNAGAAAYRQALTTEEKYRAVVTLISEAMERGERLAALDLAAKFLPAEMTQRLRENGQLLREMQETADRIKPAQLASAEDIGYANELKRRMEEAQKIIENGLKPLQRDLTQLGLNYQETWVNITEIMAKAVTLANQLYDWLKSIPAAFAAMGNSPIWGRISAATDALGLNSKPAWINELDKPGAANSDPGGASKARLAAMLSDTNAVKKAMQEVIDIQTRVRGEMSKPIASPTPAAKAAQETTDAVDRMLNSLNRSIEMQKADTAAVGLGARALAEFRAQALFNAAVTANGGKVTDEQSAAFARLKIEAGLAAEALEKAREALQFQTALAAAATTGIDTFVNGLVSGKSAADSFRNALDGIAKALQNIGQQSLQRSLTGLFSGRGLSLDFGSLALGGIGSIISGVLGSSQRRREEQRRAEEERIRNAQAAEERMWRLRDRQAAMKDTQDLAGALAKFERDAQWERLEESKAGGQNLALLEQVLAADRQAIIDEWAKKAVEAERERAEQALAVIQQRATFEKGLWADISSAAGKSYLTDFVNLVDRLAENMAEAARIGFTDTAQIDKWFLSSAQSIIDGAELTGAAFDEVIRLFPQLAGAVHEFTGAAEEEAKRLQEEARRAAEEFQNFLSGLSRNIREFIDNFRGGTDTNLSPSARLAAAQSAYNSQLGLAQGGDRDAANGLTQYADRLIDALRSFYGSSSTAQSGINTILSQLEALPGQISSEQYIVNAITDMKSVLVSAIQSNSPALIAQALSGYFNQLDTNGDNLLSSTELLRYANQNQLSNILSTLDTDGDGQISRLEAIKGSTANTKSAVDTSNQYIPKLDQINQTIATVSAYESTTAQATAQSASRLAAIDPSSQVTAQRTTDIAERTAAMRGMMQLQNQNWGRDANQTGVFIGTFRDGGYTGNKGVNDVAGIVHGQEYVFTADQTRMWGVQNLERLAQGQVPMARMANDNGANVVAAIRSLENQFRAFRSERLKTAEITTRAVTEKLDDVTDAIDDSGREARILAA